MKKYPYKEAKALVRSIFKAATDGEYDTREKFLAMLEANPDVAAQGYNAYGKIFFWNQASSLLYGHSESATFNKDIFETILPPEMRPFARDLVLSATQSGTLPEPSSCDLLRQNGDYVLRHLNGHRKVSVGGKAVKECVLKDNDEIRIGNREFTFQK